MTEKKLKDFDCVEFKNKAQEQIYENVKDLIPEEQILISSASQRMGHWVHG